MMRCDECQARLLDYQYGLLEPDELAAVEAHLAACPACPAALADAAKTRDLFARAAKLSFPEVRFAAPAEPPTVPAAPAPARRTWPSWAVAAGLLLAIGLTLPVASDWASYLRNKGPVEGAFARLDGAAAEKERLKQEGNAKSADAQRDRDAAEKKHDELVALWVAEDLREDPNRVLRLTVSGPPSAVPGAPNDYTVAVLGKDQVPVAAEITATVRAGETEYFSTTFTWKPGTRAPAKITLPASLWTKLPADVAEVILTVTARDPKTGAKATLAEPIKLHAPVNTTFLVTDKPLYRPGEPVFFRSLTLDRTTFRPPSRDLTLRYEITRANDPAGADPIAKVTGRAEPVRPAADGRFEPVLGPDGKPVRGVGSGVFQLADTLAGGEYVLTAYEVPANHPTDAKRPNTVPLAVRKLIVLKYQPETLLKTLEFDARSYGPGDTVRAKLTVRDQAKSVSGATVFPEVKGVAVNPAPAQTDTVADGTANITFTLPNDSDLHSASLSVLVAHGAARETIVRPIPVAPRSLVVEFFPEGGDLVAGVPNRVYFRATTPAGKPADIDGYLTDGSRSISPVKTVTDPDHPGANQGAGVFSFTPESGKRYAVRLLRPTNVATAVDDKSGMLLGGWAAARAGVYPLPKALANGVVMSIPEGVADAGQPIRVTLRSNDRRDLYVGAYARGVAVAAGKVTVEPGKPAELVLKPAAGGGVTRVTVFEEPDQARGRTDLTPVAERLIYRRPVESLRLGFTPDRRQYAPGDAVNLAVTAAKETGEPTAAVLWVAVVNQSVLTMADDKAERHLPTHFLLAGEVRKPDDLEHADFFLTGHPKAAESLDLLLGTQGWRRFAEQAPGRFRATVGEEEKNRFLVSAGVRPTLPTSRDGPADGRFVPEYRQAARDYAAAQMRVWEARNETTERLQTIAVEEAADQSMLMREAHSAFYLRIEDRRGWLPAAAAAGLVIGIGALLRPTRRVAGRPAMIAGVGLIALAVFLLAADLSTRNATDWRPRIATFSPGPMPVPPPEPQPDPADGRNLVENARHARAPIARPIAAAADDPAFLTRIGVPIGGRVHEWLKDPVMPDGTTSADPVMVFENAIRQHRIREGGEASEDEKTAARRVARQVVRHSPFVAREYAHTRTAAPAGDATRTDFTETVLWHPLLVLPADGKANVAFALSDSIQAYRVLVAGHTLDGRLGATSGLIEVRKPLAVDVKLPAEVTAGDRIDLPINVTNGTATKQDAKLSLWSDHLTFPEADRSLPVPPRGSAGLTVPLTVPARAGTARVRAGGAAGAGLTDAVERTVSVVPDGFPAAGSAAGVLARKTAATVTLPDQLVPGTLAAKVVVYTNAVAEVQAGLDGLLREPHGCFEQASTANYPNVLILDYLKEIGKHNPTAVENARGLLERGYARLLGFEVMKKEGTGREGFEWFGQFPPHEPLTAYGLMQFADMARVHPVDPTLLARTKDYLLARRDGTGGFRRPAEAHAFGDVPPAVADAYILWAITEAERGSAPSDLAKELSAVAKAAADSGDPYHLALAASALLNRRESDRAQPLLAQLAAKQAADGSVPGAAHTITRSAGPDVVTETTALAALAWQKAPPAFGPNARAAVKALHGRRTAFGAFGSTQATILTLKALTEHARANRKPAEAGRVVVRIGGKEVGAAEFNTDGPEPATVVIPDPEKLLRAGANAVEVECTGAGEYPFAVSWSAATRKPATDPACVVKLTTALDAADAAEGRTVRLSLMLENTSAAGQGMAVAVVGLPAGLKLPPDAKQLKDLTAAGAVAHWELPGRELVLYWRELAPKQAHTIALDLIADVPGEYRGPAGRAYLYYHPQAKAWADPLAVRVRPANP